MSTPIPLERVIQDLRYAIRVLRKSPGFAIVAIASLALGIGANTAIFQLLNAVRLRTLPVVHPEQLAEVRIVGGNVGMGINPGPYGHLTRPIWQEIRAHHEPFSSVFAWRTDDFGVGDGNELRRVHGLRVSGEFFGVLGVQPWRGRLLHADDDRTACPATSAVVSYSYWAAELGSRDPGAGTVLTVNGVRTEIVGVTPPQFLGLAVGESFDIALPFCRPKELDRNVFDVSVIGRLRPDWSVARATAHFDAVSPGIFEITAPTGYSSSTIERFKHFRLGVYPASNGVSSLRTAYSSSLSLLLAISALVLLIACANLTNLMLARANAREREIAVRLALGASRGRLIRQLLGESILLAGAGSALAVGLAHVLSRALVRTLSTESSSVFLAMPTDWRVLIFTAAAATVTCALFGAVPALRATKADPVRAMKSGGRTTTAGWGTFSVQRLLVIAQIAVALVLLTAAFLFVRSFRNLMTFDPGMREAGITIAFMVYPQTALERDRHLEFQRALLDEVRSIPGILGAAATTNTPLLGSSWGHGIRVGSREGSSQFTWVSPGYFQLMGIPVIAGRDFDRNDTQTSQRVALVNQTFVRRFLSGLDPIGQTILTSPEPGYPSTMYQIVGVIADTKYNTLRGDTPPMTFAPTAQFPAPGPGMAMMIYSNAASADVARTIKAAIGGTHPEVMMSFQSFQGRIRDGLVRERLVALLSGFFGVLAVVLTSVGLYGVIAYIVSQRRNEIGIRMALGARRAQVVRMVMRDAVWLLGAGLVIGMALSLIFGRWAGTLLFGLQPHDPLTLASSAGLLAMITAVAAFLPARAASNVNPMVALRWE